MYKVLRMLTFAGRIYQPGEIIRQKVSEELESAWIENRVVAFVRKPDQSTPEEAGKAGNSDPAPEQAETEKTEKKKAKEK